MSHQASIEALTRQKTVAENHARTHRVNEEHYLSQAEGQARQAEAFEAQVDEYSGTIAALRAIEDRRRRQEAK